MACFINRIKLKAAGICSTTTTRPGLWQVDLNLEIIVFLLFNALGDGKGTNSLLCLCSLTGKETMSWPMTLTIR